MIITIQCAIGCQEETIIAEMAGPDQWQMMIPVHSDGDVMVEFDEYFTSDVFDLIRQEMAPTA